MRNTESPSRPDDTHGLGPAPRQVDRHAPYLRIATEEAWNIPEVLEAQVRLLASPGAPDDPSLRMAGIPTYGIQGFFMDTDDMRMHGRDERMSVQSFYEGQQFLYELVKTLSSQ